MCALSWKRQARTNIRLEVIEKKQTALESIREILSVYLKHERQIPATGLFMSPLTGTPAEIRMQGLNAEC
jgi:hypothetical protein